jgi:hypothetical protein
VGAGNAENPDSGVSSLNFQEIELPDFPVIDQIRAKAAFGAMAQIPAKTVFGKVGFSHLVSRAISNMGFSRIWHPNGVLAPI